MSSIARSSISGILDTIIAQEQAKGKSRREAMVTAMREAAKMRFEANGRAMKYMERFLSGKGGEESFKWEELSRDDATVKKRVHSELVRRTLQIPTLREQYENPPSKAPDSVITIFQPNFSSVDWWGALGTFNINFLVRQPPSTPVPYVQVRIWGENEYKWHPDRDSASQKLHKIGDELTQPGTPRAKNFLIKMEPIDISVSINDMTICTLMQENPVGPGSLPTKKAMAKAKDKIAELGYSDVLINTMSNFFTGN